MLCACIFRVRRVYVEEKDPKDSQGLLDMLEKRYVHIDRYSNEVTLSLSVMETESNVHVGIYLL